MPFGSKAQIYGFPLDTPRYTGDRPLREADLPGSAKFIALEPSHPLRARTGDLSEATRVPARSSHEFNGDQNVFRFTTPPRR